MLDQRHHVRSREGRKLEASKRLQQKTVRRVITQRHSQALTQDIPTSKVLQSKTLSPTLLPEKTKIESWVVTYKRSRRCHESQTQVDIYLEHNPVKEVPQTVYRLGKGTQHRMLSIITGHTRNGENPKNTSKLVQISAVDLTVSDSNLT